MGNPSNQKPAQKPLRPVRVFMCSNDLRLFFGSLIGSDSGIAKHWQAIRDSVGKTKRHHRVTIHEFAAYEGIPIETVIEVINAADQK